MQIESIEIANFRKLLAVKIDISESTTLLVGANNSGKTSAMLALRRFLSPKHSSFELTDFTLSHWETINTIGESWLNPDYQETSIQPWIDISPALDIWLKVENSELHYVSRLIPTLDWEGGLLGVRYRLQPKDTADLRKAFEESIVSARAIREAADATISEPITHTTGPAPSPLKIWPNDMVEFLERHLNRYFEVRAYVLDPSKAPKRESSVPSQQSLPANATPVQGAPLAGIVRVNEINAQRGLGESQAASESEVSFSNSPRLSAQLRTYYDKHLDPTNHPAPSDLSALRAIGEAQAAFDARLTDSFRSAFDEVASLGYPGVTDPRPRVSTRLRASDGLNHSTAVYFHVDRDGEQGAPSKPIGLPEGSNGLGYQNLISIIFRLMDFRDSWMRTSKAAREIEHSAIEPILLVLVEEPEAHLHAQVQQVFIKKAYSVLRDHPDLTEPKPSDQEPKRTLPSLRTQMIVSTHSSHVAHETSYENLRYFRRLPAGMGAPVPVSTVSNLSGVFGAHDETANFVTRYIRAQHADLFFADAAILVEGPAERMLLPNFIRQHYPFLDQCYITMLEIGGSHAHKLRPLIECLGLTTLIITDLDAAAGKVKAPPKRNRDQHTTNSTLKDWLPKQHAIDFLLDATENQKERAHDPLFSVRVAYQTPITATLPEKSEGALTVYPYTFEDALALQNISFFSTLPGGGLAAAFRKLIAEQDNIETVAEAMFEALKNGRKAELALDVIASPHFDDLTVPTYIGEGLRWLETKLKKGAAEASGSNEKGAQ